MNDIDVFVIAGGKCGSSTLKQTYPEISEYGDKIYAFKLAKNSN